MKERKTPTARQYYRAFYQNNRVCFVLTLVFTIATFPTGLIGSWLLGEVVDVISAGDLPWLWRTLTFAIVFTAVIFFINLALYYAKSRFVHKALAQYKALAFQNLSEKSISAFSRENTGRYISVLTNDVNSVEENYLKRSFVLLFDVLLLFGSLGMMFWYSPALTIATIILSLFPLAASLLMGKELAAREKVVSDKNESFVAQLKDLLSGFAVIKSFKAETEAQRMFDAANRDAHTALKVLLRPDGSCNHIAILDPITGELLENPAGQGYASGWEPKIRLEEGLAKTIAYFENELRGLKK